MWSISQWVLPITTWIVGFGSAFGLEFIRNKRRLRAVAHVLLADAERIRSELGKRRARLVVTNFYGLSFAVPTIHPWVEKSVTEGAEIDPRVVDSFLRLDRQLTNMRHLLKLFQDSAVSSRELKEAQEEQKRAVLEAWIREEDVSELVKRAPEGHLATFANVTQFAEEAYLDEHSHALTTIEEIREQLTTYLR